MIFHNFTFADKCITYHLTTHALHDHDVVVNKFVLIDSITVIEELQPCCDLERLLLTLFPLEISSRYLYTDRIVAILFLGNATPKILVIAG